MSDLRTSLEQARLEFPAPDLPIEHVLQRRDRNQRNRRIGARVAAAVIAVLAFALAASVIDRSDSEVPAGPVVRLGTGELAFRSNGGLSLTEAFKMDPRVLIETPFVAEGCDAALGCAIGDQIAWSADGATLAFEAGVSDDEHNSWGIYVVHDGAAPALVGTCAGHVPVDGPCTELVVSPAGDRVAFGAEGNPSFQIVEVSTKSVEMCDGCTHGLVFDPTWSPDGTMIAFAGPTGSMGVMNADGTDVRILMPFPATAGSSPPTAAPVWSPDGKIWAIDDDGCSHAVRSIDPATGGSELLFGLPSGCGSRIVRVAPLPGGEVAYAELTTGRCGDPSCLGFNVYTSNNDRKDFTLTTAWCCGPIDPDSLSMLEDHVAFAVQPSGSAPGSVRVGRLVYRGADVPVWQPTAGTS